MTTPATAPAYGGNGHNGKGAALVAAPDPKFCPKCKEWKERGKFGHRDDSPDGLQGWCKACHADYLRAWRQTHGMKPRQKLDPETRKAKRREYDRAYNATHRDKRAEQRQRYRAKNLALVTEKARARARRYREANRDRLIAKSRAYYQANKERENEKARQRMLARRARQSQVSKPPKVKVEKAPLVLQPELQQAITAFLNVKALKRPGTQERYTYSLTHYARYLIKTDLPQWSNEAEVWADNVNAFLAAEKARGLKDQTVDGYYRDLTAWLRWLKRRKKIQGDLTDLIEMIERPPRVKSLPKVVKEDDAARLLSALNQAAGGSWLHLRDRALIILALDSGVRIGELASLTLDKLDMKHRTIAAKDTKTNEDRTVVFSERAAAPLADWLDKRLNHLNVPENLREVFISDYQRHGWRFLTINGIGQMLKRWQKRAGVKRFNFHRLRHSYAVYTLRAGGDLLDVQRQLGHTSIATTAIYARVDDSGRQGRHNLANPLGYLLSQGGAL